MLTLEVVRGTARGTKFPIDTGTVTIGRSSTNQLVLADWHLSGEHGQIFREEDQYIYKALRSTNGSRIRRGSSEFAVETHQEAALRDGDRLLLGDPAEPVEILCHVDIAEVENDNLSIEALRTVDEAEQAADTVVGNSATARKLLAVTRKLARRGLDLPSVFDGVAEGVFDLMPRATDVAIALANERDAFTTVFARTRASLPKDDVRVARAVIQRVIADRNAFLARRGDLQGSTLGVDASHVIGAPLWDGEAIRGVIQVHSRFAGALGGVDLDVMFTIAGQAALAIENARLYQRVKIAEEKARSESKYLKTREEKRRFANIIGESPAMQNIFKQIDKVKDTRATVCIEGETGTGKELIASAIHYQGDRRDKLFVAQNCAAVPETLLESELFGHKKGAFTGADHDKKGLFEIADSGTLFLDEIGEMALGLQAKLLRALQEGKIRPVGATVEKAVDVRIICATNRSLEKEVESGKFRQDLYYRLKVFPVLLPPLRERREDIEILVRNFLARYEVEFKKNVLLTSETMDALVAYKWPGNIRELQNEVQRLVIQADPEMSITADMLSPQIRKVEGLLGRIAPKKGTLKDMMEDVERWLLAEALRDHGGNKTKTAETLGITREGLHKKLAKFGM